MELKEIISDICAVLTDIDASRLPFKNFQAGVGPYGEPQLLREIALRLNDTPKYRRSVVTKRTPDMLIPEEWAMEFKIVRPFGDNARQAENWSVNLLHPYPGNTSTIGDCLKLLDLDIKERKAVSVIGYTHDPPLISLDPLVKAFETIAKDVMAIRLGERIQISKCGLVHPVHQQVIVFAWEVLGNAAV